MPVLKPIGGFGSFANQLSHRAIGTTDILQWGSKVIGCTHCTYKEKMEAGRPAKPIIAGCSTASNGPGAQRYSTQAISLCCPFG